ncbi:MAG: hypothetical protein LUG27_09550 [Clostridiales bacterium]|nr:hypothetical protein [Clostridiales bacterium]
MSKKLTKRLLSLVLTLSMMCSLAVTPALAADGSSDTAASGTVTASDSEDPEYIEAGNLIAEDEGCVEIVETDPATESGQGNSADNGVAVASDDTETDDADSSVISVSNADSFAEAVSTANASESAVTIQLTDDVALDTSAIFSGTVAVTLDLAGHAITRGSSTTGYLIGIGSGSNLTVTDSVGGGYIDGATYTVNGTTYVGYSILTNGTLALNSGTLKGYYGLYISGSEANVTISGSGAVEGTSRGISMNSGTLTVEAGTITGGTYGMVQFTGETTINGGTIGSAGEGRGIQHQGGSLTINGGTVLGEYAVTSNAYNASTTLTVTGGIIGDTSDSTDDLSSMALVGVFVIGSTTTYDAKAYISGGTITAYDSGVYIQGNVAAGDTSEKDSYNATVTVSDDAVIETVYNSTYGYSDSGVSVWGKGAVLNVEGGTISSGVFAIAGNGTYNTSGSGYSNAGTVINITDGEISSGGTAIYHPQYGSLIIKGGTITGETTGIEIRSGEVSIEGGKISAEYDPLTYTENPSGTTIAGAALAVAQHTTMLDIAITISDGEFEGFFGVYEKNVQENEYTDGTDYSDHVSVEITGGKFLTTYPVKDANYDDITTNAEYKGYAVYENSEGVISIKGGYYNSDPSEYCVSPYYVVSRSDNVSTGDLALTYYYYVTGNRIVGTGMDLESGVIEIEFYVRADATDYAAIETFTLDEDELELSDYDTATVEGYSCYVIPKTVVANKMTEEFDIVLELYGGYAIKQTTSLKTMVKDWLDNADESTLASSEAEVLITMLNLGAATQLLDDSSLTASKLANEGYAYGTDATVSTLTEIYNSLSYSSLSNYKLTASGTGDKVGLKGIGVTCDSDFGVVLYTSTNLDEYKEENRIEVQVDGVTCDNIEISDYAVEVSDLSAVDLTKEITFIFTDGDGDTYSLTATGIYFARFLMNSKYYADSTINFAKCMYMYISAVNELISENSQEGGSTAMIYVFNEPEIEVVSLAMYDDEVTTNVSSGEVSVGGDTDVEEDDLFN